MQITCRFLAVLALALTAACEPPPEFTATLSDPGEVGYDERVLGRWYQQIDDDVVVLAAISDASAATESGAQVPESNNKMLRISLTLQETKANDAISLPFTAFASRMDGSLYYNLAHARAPFSWDVTVPDQSSAYYIVQAFTPTPDTLLVCLLTGFSHAGEPGSDLTPRSVDQPIHLNGVPLQNGDDWEHKFVDGSRDDLRRYVGQDRASRFTQAFYLTRVGTPWKDPGDDPQHWAQINQYRDRCDVDELREP